MPFLVIKEDAPRTGLQEVVVGVAQFERGDHARIERWFRNVEEVEQEKAVRPRVPPAPATASCSEGIPPAILSAKTLPRRISAMGGLPLLPADGESSVV